MSLYHVIDIMMPPLVGALIGAFTNHLAVRMIFRPYTEKRVLGLRLPFTPGLFPRKRDEITDKLVNKFEEKLLSSEDLLRFMDLPSYKATFSASLEASLDKMLAKFPFMTGLAETMKPVALEQIDSSIDKFLIREGPALVRKMDLRSKIRARIDDMDIKELEEMVLGFSKEEFRFITYGGAFLGALIGLSQVILQYFL